MQKDEQVYHVEAVCSASETTLASTSEVPADRAVYEGHFREDKIKQHLVSKASFWGSLWLFALALVLGHFFFYWRLDGRSASHQDYTLKAGTAFAFTYKAVLCAAVSMAMVPVLWATVSEKELSLSSLNKLFTLDHSAAGLLSWELLRKGHIVASFGAIMIAVSVSAVFPPGTMSVALREHTQLSTCHVPNINLRNGTLKEDELQDAGDILEWSPLEGSWGGAPEAKSLAALVSYGGTILNMDKGGSGRNCTFSTTFVGPALKCEDADWSSGQRIFEMPYNSPGNISGDEHLMYQGGQDPTDGNIWLKWMAYTPSTLSRLNISYTPSGIPWCSMTTDYPDHMHPCLDKTVESGLSNFTSKCALYNSTYNINVTYTSGTSEVTHWSVDLGAQYNATLRNMTAAESVSLEDRLELRRAFGLMDTLYMSFLSGNLIAGPSSGPGPGDPRGLPTYGAGTEIVATNLTETWMIHTSDKKDATYKFPRYNLDRQVEQLFQNITISLLARPDLVFSSTRETTCNVLPHLTTYEFDAKTFWASYGTGLLLGLIAIAVGALHMFKNGQFREASFTSIAVTTMDSSLKELTQRVNDEEQQASSSTSHVLEERLSKVRVVFEGGSFKVKEN